MVYDRNLGKSFKKVGEIYHLGRRDYPKNLMKDIIRISGIKNDSCILDVGCGTGKSTVPFAEKGYKIIGIDISDKMLKIARKSLSEYKNVRYKKTSFEKSNFIANSFDLIIFGTAMHWLDPKMAYKIACNILKKRGHIAIFWEPIKYLDKHIRKLKMREIFLRNCPNYPRNHNTNVTIIKMKNNLTKHKLFQKPIVKKYHSIQNYTKKEFWNLVNSYSWVISLSKNNKEKLMREVRDFLGNKKSIKLSTEFYLVIAKRK